MAKKDLLLTTNTAKDQEKTSFLLNNIEEEKKRIKRSNQAKLNAFANLRSSKVAYLQQKAKEYQIYLSVQNKHTLEKYKKELPKNSNIKNVIKDAVSKITAKINKQINKEESRILTL